MSDTTAQRETLTIMPGLYFSQIAVAEMREFGFVDADIEAEIVAMLQDGSDHAKRMRGWGWSRHVVLGVIRMACDVSGIGAAFYLQPEA